MTLLEYALIGFVIGILTTAPVGPVNVMAIQHAAQQGIRNGLTVGLGAVFADVIYASVAVFGVSAVTTFLDSQFDLIRIVGGLVLILFGLKVFTTHPHLTSDTDGSDTPSPKVGGDMAIAFFMVLTNPGTAFGFVAIMGALGEWRPAHGDHVGAATMVIGVGLGATSWWAGLSALVARFKDKINDAWMDRANRIAGTILICFGAVIYVDLVFGVD